MEVGVEVEQTIPSPMMQFVFPRLLVLTFAVIGIQLVQPSVAPRFLRNDLIADDFEFFEKRIRPVLLAHCYECHSGTELSGGLSVESREQLLLGGDSGPAIDVELTHDGHSTGHSLLLRAVEYETEHLQMPPQGKLPGAIIADLRFWIERGAQDPREPPGDGVQYPSRWPVTEQVKDYWAFQAPISPEIPSVVNQSWVQSPIDSFILQKLELLNIQPAPIANKRTLIRRLYLDLIGLPPTPAQVADFLRDTSHDAYGRLVERLLASPQYGVRWGRHWLDVVRYADSNGLDENMAYGNAWRYRDYVVDALNADKPFDQLVIEQIAGDLLPTTTTETRVATGFLSLGAKVLAEPDGEKLLMDTIDEQIDTVGKTFLGLTLGCARCHDHKFDPITQADYYGLAAIFKGTKSFSGERYGAIRYWYEHRLDDDCEPEYLKRIDEEIASAKSAAGQFKSQTVALIRDQARRQAAEYLTAAAQVELGAALNEIADLAEPFGLNPRILQHCRQHLANQRDNPFFAAWNRLKEEPDQVHRHYSNLFAEVDVELQRLQQANPEQSMLDDPILEQAHQERMDPFGFLAVPVQPEYAFDSESLSEYYRLMEIARVLESNAPDRGAAMGVADGDPQHQLPIHIRGSHLNLGESVPRSLPAVMVSSNNFQFPEDQSGRLQLAQWLVDSANPLTARVMVNRVWGWHFGRPLVSSTENFGLTGQMPTHPELLDWLSIHFINSGWSIKSLHRLLLNSSCYQMASGHPGSGDEQWGNPDSNDPDNNYFWKFRIQRLDAEQLRDSILAVSERLDNQLAGKTLPLRNHQFVFDHTSIDHTRYDSVRRAIYLPVIRNNLYPMFEQFDYPDPTMPTGLRQSTTVAPQALLLLNSPLMIDNSSSLAEIVLSNHSDFSTRLEYLYLVLFSRSPSESERARCLSFLTRAVTENMTAEHSGRRRRAAGEAKDSFSFDDDSELIAWSTLVQGLMATNEFLYVR
jgi:hypothetical protein